MSWGTIITIILIAAFCIALSIFFSVRRRLDKKSQDEANPELRQAYQDIRRQIDRLLLLTNRGSRQATSREPRFSFTGAQYPDGKLVRATRGSCGQ